ncbi:MAG: hypothetical protein IJ752_05340 [Alphaproteobacteria bacterium]|nr:hypothetical protein [Alphaproteobacteria bacterium]
MARIAFIALFAAMATGMFVIKNKVIALENDLEKINAQIKEDQNALHVLKAEWTYLNDPARIRDLSERHAHMKPLRGEQIISFSSIPLKNKTKGQENIIRVSFAASAGR